jgi:hypothetical protein
MELTYGLSAYKRDRGNFPELPVVNMFVEVAQTEPKGVALISRPPLAQLRASVGTGVTRGIYKKDGVLDGDEFKVVGSQLFRNNTLVGSITGSGFVSMAGNEIGLAICAGADIHFYNGTALGVADFPDDADVAKVIATGGRFIALRKDTGKFYWTDVLDNALVGGILTFGGLAFATAENQPDSLNDICVVDDKVALGGSECVEFWTRTGDDDLPYSPIEGMIYEKGVRATGCLLNFDNTAVFISGDNIVYRASNVPERISDTGIEERIAGSATCEMFTWFFEGHEILSIRLDSETVNYDANGGQWCEFATYGQDNWAASCAAKGPIFGSGIDGRTLEFGDYDDGELGSQLERRFRAGMPLDGGALRVDNIRLRCNAGQGALGVEPVIEMRVSRDAGMTWGNWKPVKLGTQGKYRTLPEWRALGMFDAPGILAEFRCSDDVSFRVSGVNMNEPKGGRSRG